MKKNFKHYKQALSAVLISMMVLQPISSLPSAWATEYDPEAVFDIEDEDSWFYEDEDDENIYSRATISTNSNAGKWGVTGFTLSAEGTAEAGKSYTITGTITAANPASPSNPVRKMLSAKQISLSTVMACSPMTATLKKP